MAPPGLFPLNTGAANSGASNLFPCKPYILPAGIVGTMDDTLADQDEWELRKAIPVSLGQDLDKEADVPIQTQGIQDLSYTGGLRTTGNPIQDTGGRPDEPNKPAGTLPKPEAAHDDDSSSDDSGVGEHPSDMPLDELEVSVRHLDLASVKLTGYERVSPLVFWLQGFGRGNPIHKHFRNMSDKQLATYAHGRKINTALDVLKSELLDRRDRAIVAIQKYHADYMIDKVLDALRDATPEEHNLYDYDDRLNASRVLQQWLKWQRRAARVHGLPPGGPPSQEPLNLDKLMHDRLDKEDTATFRHRYELHASKPQRTKTQGSLVWLPGGSLTYPVNNLPYLSTKKGIPVRLPAATRVWDATEDRTKLTRRMPDYAMLYTPEIDGDGQFYLDQSRHRRGAVAVPAPLPPIPKYDQTTNTWSNPVPPFGMKTSEEAQARSPPASVHGINAPSMYPAELQARLQNTRQTGPPRPSSPQWDVHDVWGLPPRGPKQRDSDQMVFESLPAIKRGRRVVPLERIDPNVTQETDPDDPVWSPPSPKSGPGAPRSCTLSLNEQGNAKFEALLKKHSWQWPKKDPDDSRSSSSGDEEEVEEQIEGEEEEGKEEQEERDDKAVEDDRGKDNDRDGHKPENNAKDRSPDIQDPSVQPQKSDPDTNKEASERSGNTSPVNCQEPTVNSRNSNFLQGIPSEDLITCQKLGLSLTQLPFLLRTSWMSGLRGGGNMSGTFGNSNSTTAPTTLGTHTVSKPAATQAGGGLFGNNTTTSSAPAASSSLFGSALGTSQAPAATTTAGSSVFGGGGLGIGTSKASLFGNNATTTQASSASTGGGGLFSGNNTTSQQANTGSSLFGSSTQTPQNQQTVPAVRIDASNIKPTTRFSELHEDVQQQILAIDEIIQASIEKCLQCSQVLPQLGASVEALPGDVELLETKLETVDGALSRDAQAVGASKEVINADALDALKVFRAVENLKLPAQFHYSSIGGGFNGGSGSGAIDEDGSTDLLPYFGNTANRLEKEIFEYQRVVVEVESHLRTVEGSAVEGIHKVVKRRQMMGASHGQNGVNGHTNARKEGLRELAGTMRGFEEAVLRVAGRVGEARENVVELSMGISRR
ncbi:hypothetical protein FKW77_009655 [Venturia effusa]|uniref:Uncharacterized protein n=1 Tax=Venturia effusa TaxID=50376 RepID=A0A517LD16_9PEZI|nr:hypothetical protein FKW77_009655 [Venturia effusa]